MFISTRLFRSSRLIYKYSPPSFTPSPSPSFSLIQFSSFFSSLHNINYLFNNHRISLLSTPSSSSSSLSSTSSSNSNSTSGSSSPPIENVQNPNSVGSVPPGLKYHCTFTCVKCDNRSSYTISKQAYHHGVVLIRCHGCNVLHLFADHLKWFDDKRQTIESIMEEKGIKIKKIQPYQHNNQLFYNSSNNDNNNISTDSSPPPTSSKLSELEKEEKIKQLTESEGVIQYEPTQ